MAPRVLFGKLAEVASEYLRKGSQVISKVSCVPVNGPINPVRIAHHRSRGERWRHHADAGWSSGGGAPAGGNIGGGQPQGGWGRHSSRRVAISSAAARSLARSVRSGSAV